MKEHGKNVTIEDIQAEEQMLAEEHKKNLEAGIYKKKEIKAPRKKEVGISIKENIQQSIQYSRRPVIGNSDKGKGIMIEEPNLEKKDNSTSDIAQVETRLAKSTSDAAQVDDTTKVMTTSDVAQVVQKSTQLPGFSKPKLLEDLKLEAVNFSETRTVLGKEAFDKSGLGSHRERRTNNRSQDKFSLEESGVGITQEGLDKLESVQMIFHKGIKKEFLLYFMADGRVYRVGEFDIQLKLWEELEYVLYLFEVKNRSTYDAARVLKERMMKSKVLSGAGVSSAYIPKYRDAHGKLVEMKRNSARFRTALNKKVLEFNLESDKPFYIRLGNEMDKNSIYSLRAAIYQTGEFDPELKEVKKIMVEELERAEKKLLSDYIRTVPDIQEIKKQISDLDLKLNAFKNSALVAKEIIDTQAIENKAAIGFDYNKKAGKKIVEFPVTSSVAKRNTPHVLKNVDCPVFVKPFPPLFHEDDLFIRQELLEEDLLKEKEVKTKLPRKSVKNELPKPDLPKTEVGDVVSNVKKNRNGKKKIV
ncbi:hypothetical protein POM88_041075 [Heracleum sosnowskyi]|uniref:Uncharacterized protein n=1 Tax=Heracleum sosnowskyi TaxID=360622 RepID=A0AAD8HE35_9APIA|nr:hypothetical protein POM88_041075 [Heracleum sosnowskyi]